jgi:nicotinamide mononucleotide transporter
VAVFVQAKIYAEALLFCYYVLMGIYGWYQWQQGRELGGEVKVDSWGLRQHIAIAFTGYAAVAAMYQLLHRYTDAAMPLLDSYTTAISFAATWLTARRVLENWLYWVVVNLCSIYLYAERGLPAFAALAALYSVLSVYGYAQWRQHRVELKQVEAAP